MEKAIAGIDTGLTRCGVVVFRGGIPVAAETITEKRPTKAQKGSVRTADLLVEQVASQFRKLRDFLVQHGVAAVVVETPSAGAKSAIAMRDMSLGSAMVVCTIESLGLPAEWVPPATVKSMVSGGSRRNASKQEVEDFVLRRFPEMKKLLPKPKVEREHAADAAAVYLAAEHGQLVRMYTQGDVR